MPEIRVLLIDDKPTAEVFRRLVGTELPVHQFLSGDLVTAECTGFGCNLTLHIQWLQGERASIALSKIPDAVSNNLWDLILVDDNWEADGSSEGQETILPCVIEHAMGEPMFVLFTDHWGQIARRIQFGKQISAIGATRENPSTLRRVWGMGKSDNATFGLLLQRILAEQDHRAQRDELQARLDVHQDDDDAEEVRGDMIGDSAPMRELYRILARYANSPNGTVLIHGESGVGKELVARAVHYAGSRKEEPFVAVNCGALTESLLESELFGHEKNAFNNATEKQGKFELANGGTIFLDEVAEMSVAMQIKLLRVIELKEFERVGGNKPIRVDVRVIAATHQNLRQMVKEKNFREDLFFRLDVLTCTIPPLRKRLADVRLLAEHFTQVYSQTLGRSLVLSDASIEALKAKSWSGNVRVLKNTIERTCVVCRKDTIEPSDIQFSADHEIDGNGREDGPPIDGSSAEEVGQIKDWMDEIELGAQAAVESGKKLTHSSIVVALKRLGKLGPKAGSETISYRITKRPDLVRFHLSNDPAGWPLIRTLRSVMRILNVAESST